MHTLKPPQQFCEIFERLDLGGSVHPFTLCLECNVPLHPIEKAEVLMRIPPSVRERFDTFSTCDNCNRVFWEGSHWRRMRDLLDGCIRTESIPHLSGDL